MLISVKKNVCSHLTNGANSLKTKGKPYIPASPVYISLFVTSYGHRMFLSCHIGFNFILLNGHILLFKHATYLYQHAK